MKKLFVILAMMLIGLASCDEGTQPEEPEVVEFKAERIYSPCAIPLNTDTSEIWIINSEEDKKKIKANEWSDCNELKQIDLSKNTLIGTTFVSGTRCPAPSVYPRIEKNVLTKTYDFIFDYDRPGPCTSPYTTRVWFLIPKIESGYSIQVSYNYIGGLYTHDSVGTAKNLKLWISNTEYGTEKTVFKKGEPMYINYSFKNYTGKPLEWCQTESDIFCEIIMRNGTKTYYSPEDRKYNDTTVNGVLKTDETMRVSWKANELPVGEYTAEANRFRDFKYLLLANREIKFTVEE